MPNTFKTVTKAGVTGVKTIYEAGGSVNATVVLGLMVCNTTSSGITIQVKLVSDTQSRVPTATTANGANSTVFLVKDGPVPVGGTQEFLGGNKIVLEDTDSITLLASGAADIALSIMEIT
tara:strand:+ start:5112 stop:5471 length:360 start_codon:yes stop_codon:yes gene_type:complete